MLAFGDRLAGADCSKYNSPAGSNIYDKMIIILQCILLVTRLHGKLHLLNVLKDRLHTTKKVCEQAIQFTAPRNLLNCETQKNCWLQWRKITRIFLTVGSTPCFQLLQRQQSIPSTSEVAFN